MRLDQIGPAELQRLSQFADHVAKETERQRAARGGRLVFDRAGLLALATTRALHEEVLVLQNAHFFRAHGQGAYAEQLTRQYDRPLLPAQYLAHCAILAQLAETEEVAAQYKEQAHAMAVRNGYLPDRR
jgi:hypothetical protein